MHTALPPRPAPEDFAKLLPQGPARGGPGARRWGGFGSALLQWEVVGPEEGPGVSPTVTPLSLQATEGLGRFEPGGGSVRPKLIPVAGLKG